jgi:hypothetical protein
MYIELDYCQDVGVRTHYAMQLKGKYNQWTLIMLCGIVYIVKAVPHKASPNYARLIIIITEYLHLLLLLDNLRAGYLLQRQPHLPNLGQSSIHKPRVTVRMYKQIHTHRILHTRIIPDNTILSNKDN